MRKNHLLNAEDNKKLKMLKKSIGQKIYNYSDIEDESLYKECFYKIENQYVTVLYLKVEQFNLFPVQAMNFTKLKKITLNQTN